MLTSAIAVAAAAVSLQGGATTFTPRADLPVRVAAVKPASVGQGALRLPITGGSIQPDSGAGRLVHAGGLRLSRGDARVRLRGPVVTIGRRSSMSVRVGGSRVKAFELDPTRARFDRAGLGNAITGVRVLLTRAGARALNQTFGVRDFRRFQALGKLDVRTQPSQLAFAGGRTDVALDPATVQALTSLGIVPAPVVPASANGDGSLGFPITGGAADIETLAGRVRHAGGLTLTKDATQVTLQNFVVDTEAGTLSAIVNGGSRLDALALDLSAAQVTIEGFDVTAANVGVTLTETAAAALNAAFATTAFSAGQRIGTATVRGEAA